MFTTPRQYDRLEHATDVYSETEIAEFKASGLWQDRVLTDFLSEHASTRPNEVAVVVGDRRATWAELAEAVDRIAAGFVGLGLQPNDYVAVQLPNCLEFVQTYLAIQRAGLRAITLMAIYREHEVGFMLGKCGAKAYVVPDYYRSFSFLPMARTMRAEKPTLEHVIVVGDAPEDTTSFDELLASKPLSPADYASRRPDPDGVSKVSFTSGTTGLPKGVVHTHNTDLVTPIFLARAAELDATTPIWMPSPIAHVTGILFGPYTSLLTGAKLVLQDQWDPVAALELVSRERVKLTVSATPFIAGMLDVPNLGDYDLSSFTHFMSGGARVPPVLVERAREEMDTYLLRVFGSAEAPLHTANLPTDDWAKIVGRDGRAFPGVRNKVTDPDDRTRALGPGQLGEYASWGPHVFLGYFDDPERTWEAKDEEGWFYSGDLCEIDDDGFVLYVDRMKDIVNRGGLKISALEVENLLVTHPAVQAVAVVAVPDSRLGEHACAFVVPRNEESLSLEELTDHLKAQGVTKQKWPEELRVVPEFPVTATGKTRKVELRDMVSGSTGQGTAEGPSSPGTLR